MGFEPMETYVTGYLQTLFFLFEERKVFYAQNLKFRHAATNSRLRPKRKKNLSEA